MQRFTAAPLAALLVTLAAAPAAALATQENDPLAETWAWVVAQPRQETNALDEVTLGPAQTGFDEILSGDDPARNDDLTRHALAARLGVHLITLDQVQRGPVVEFLAAHEDLAAEMAFLLQHQDNPQAAYELLGRLIEAHGPRVAELAPLAAAICAVHDTPVARRVNENRVEGIDPVALFGYYAENERGMHFSLRETPPPLLVHLADATGSLEELEWARRRYARDRNVGNRYQEITYDTRSAQQNGAQKRVTESGEYTLQSIRQHGGVCADQAYFAMTVGKAIGIPSCYVRGRGGDASHAWIGFLEQAGRRSVRWNFSEGRYEAFEDVQGTVHDPQLDRTIPDAFLSVQALSAAVPADSRHRAAALTDAARRLSVNAWQAGGEQALTDEVTSDQLGMLRAALRLDPGHLPTWELARDIVASPTSTLEQKQEWTRAIDQVAGVQSPDFAIEILAPIFAAEPDHATRFQLWDWAAGRFRSRPDLAARARFEQARALEAQGRGPDAAAAFGAIFTEYPEAGPVSVEALAEAARLLAAQGRNDEAIDLYERAWKKLRQPRQMSGTFLEQTSWYRVGSTYAEMLELAGRSRDAGTVRRRLDR